MVFMLIGLLFAIGYCEGYSTKTSTSDFVDLGTYVPEIKQQLVYASGKNILGMRLYPTAQCFLLKNAADHLRLAAAELAAQGYGLCVTDAYRPLSAEAAAFKRCKDERLWKDPEKSAGRHTRGTSVHVTLYDLKTGKALPMPYTDDTCGAKQPTTVKESAGKEGRTLASLLAKVMTRNGFVQHPSSWTHFDLDDWRSFQPHAYSFDQLSNKERTQEYTLMQVKTPVASVWLVPYEPDGPFPFPAIPACFDPGSRVMGHITQVCYGERVEVCECDGDFYRVRLPTQFTKGAADVFRPKRGFVHMSSLAPLTNVAGAVGVLSVKKTAVRAAPASNALTLLTLPYGSVLRAAGLEKAGWQPVRLVPEGVGYVPATTWQAVSATIDRQSLMRALEQQACFFVSMPYCWGGRSMFLGKDADMLSSCDCSGALHLLFHAQGLVLPRNAEAQIAFAATVSLREMQKGDVLFLEGVAGTVPHIMLYLGSDTLFDVTGRPGTPQQGRLSKARDLFGKPLREIKEGEVVFVADAKVERVLRGGTYFGSQEKMQAMRNAFLAAYQ